MRVWPVFLLVAGCASTGGPERRVLYELSSPDVGVAWHLHGRDGALLCELPCERWIGEDSGAWVGVHDPKKSWRVTLPDELPGPPGAHVVATAHVGKGTPVLGPVGSGLAVTGATAAVAGVILLVASFISLGEGCSATDTTCSNFENATTWGSIGGPSLALGAVLGVIGYYWMDRNHAPTLRVTPTGVAASF